MTALVVNGNGVYFTDASDADYVEVHEDADVAGIIVDMLDDNDASLDDATVRRVSVMTLASVAAAAAEYLSAQVNGATRGLHERAALVGLLTASAYGDAEEFSSFRYDEVDGDAGQDDGLETHPGINA
jgi:hypothetical protein